VGNASMTIHACQDKFRDFFLVFLLSSLLLQQDESFSDENSLKITP
jgi:hypothetical protein